MKRLWLDDIREAPHGWVRVNTAKDAIDVLRIGGRIDEISLDHDLGEGNQGVADPGTGLDVLDWMLQQAMEGRWDCVPRTIHIHTANPVGAARMTWVKRRISKERHKPKT